LQNVIDKLKGVWDWAEKAKNKLAELNPFADTAKIKASFPGVTTSIGGIFSTQQVRSIAEGGVPEAIVPMSGALQPRALSILETSGLADLVRANTARQSAGTQANGASLVNIEEAHFHDGTDADFVAHRLNAAYQARTLSR
jgi:hypothetical protein